MQSEAIKSVLYVEDDAETRTFLSSVILEALAPDAFECAHDLASARECLAQLVPDLVLLDLNLPDGLGHTLIADIRARNPEAVVVILTIFDDEEHLLNALRAGADGYVLKDETREGLLALLAEILEGRPPLSAPVARKILGHLRVEGSEGATTEKVTDREQDVLHLLARGHTIAGAADELKISEHTVRHHVRNIYRKLDVSNRASMVTEAMKKGLY